MTSPRKPPTIQMSDVSAQLNAMIDVNRTWFQTHWLQIAIAVLVGALIIIGLHAVRRYVRRLYQPGETSRRWPEIFAHAASRTTNFFIAATAAKLVDGYAHAPIELAQTINFLFTIAAGFQVAIWTREITLGVIEQRAQSEHYSGETIANAMGIIRLLVTVVLFGIAIIVILSNLGVNITGLVAGLGVGGIAIGLAAQGIFADLFAALAIIFDRPFSKGDVISYDDTTGTVEDIGLKSTRVRPASGEEHIIANKQLLEKEIRNISRRAFRRNKFALGIIYQTPPDVVARIPAMLREEVEKLGHGFAQAGLVGFGDSTIDIELEYDTLSPDFASWYQGRHDVGLAILRRFAAEGITFAYPTQTSFTAAPDGTMVLPYALPPEGAPWDASGAGPAG